MEDIKGRFMDKLAGLYDPLFERKRFMNKKNIIENRANLKDNGIKDHTECEQCTEDYLFFMKDQEHEFSIGLKTILACLAFAEEKGAVPPLPCEWWHLINNRYH